MPRDAPRGDVAEWLRSGLQIQAFLPRNQRHRRKGYRDIPETERDHDNPRIPPSPPPENENPGASVADATGANFKGSPKPKAYKKTADRSTPMADLDAIVADDRQFFATNLGRQHRVRYASAAEIAEGMADSLEGKYFPLFIIVRQVMPGVRLRALVALDRDCAGCSEARASRLWSQHHKGAALEAAVAAALGGGR
jgi:hypothetical protein